MNTAKLILALAAVEPADPALALNDQGVTLYKIAPHLLRYMRGVLARETAIVAFNGELDKPVMEISAEELDAALQRVKTADETVDAARDAIIEILSVAKPVYVA